MTEEETEAILKSAHDCHEGECTIDEVSELIYELEEQKKVLNDRLDAIMNMVSKLQKANTDQKRNTDDVRAYVKDLLRVFSHEVSFVSMRLSDIMIYPMRSFFISKPGSF
mmetsp:Transcript_52738/g.78598  ORF Transcript_52738/g.78598 Transcript_52738/m.78598 type:complete len:110 (+) Transcript_52738:385-714(+)